MKTPTEKPIEVSDDRNELNQAIDEYRMFQQNHHRQNELIADLERNLEEISQEIIVTQNKVNNPVYPKMRTIADVDEFIRDFGAPHKRLELLLAARDELVKQVATAKSENSRYIDLMSDAKNATWLKLAKLLLKPIHAQLNQVLFAVGSARKDFVRFMLSENDSKDINGLGEKLTSEYGMPE